ncbi:nicotinate phosphoribosyltransferase [Dissulfurispira thermophila]|uniref:nicotinate phosphoribosyltransferase n=2 Tax=root TaxID=1 RepID=A0A7G1H2D5_9BACT|nr:nicotinate phosphoribosyltransferase [Dissulfurispira thermophila]BCB96352.1 nicotinate phosphoribosyltransferase [Dissulfurispira thermophila]
MFHTADHNDILSGKIADVYFERTLRILKAKGINPTVKAEFIAKAFPGEYQWAVFAGLEEALYLLKNLPVKVRAMEEGTIFYPYEPVMEIEGKYQDFCVYETAILGLICQASGIATKAARFKKLAGDRPVISFGARRMHPVLAPMIERNAYIGGCDGVAVVKSGEIIGEDPMGTMPHALIICMGSTVDAIKAYDEVLEPKFKRVALIDTFLDEKFECLNVAEAVGDRLFAVRFDTPGSRRGNFYRILEECRWELDIRGYKHIKFYVSGGIREEDITVLNPVVDGYGIGTSISNAPVIDYAMDIMEVEGKPLAKRGKWSGSKRVLRCPACSRRIIAPLKCHESAVQTQEIRCECGRIFEDILITVLDNGKYLIDMPSHKEIRNFVLKQLKAIGQRL